MGTCKTRERHTREIKNLTKQLIIALLLVANSNLYTSSDTPLHKAARRGDVPTIEQLVAQNPDLIEASWGHFQETPLLEAVQHLRVNAVRCLLELGANPNAKGLGSRNALLALTQTKLFGDDPEKEERIEQIGTLLLNAGTDMNQPGKNGDTPLHAAAYNNNFILVQLLLTAGVPVDQPDSNGRSALDWVTSKSPEVDAAHTKTVTVLLKHGASMMIAEQNLIARQNFSINETGYLLDNALRIGNEAVAMLLFAANAPLGIKGIDALVTKRGKEFLVTALAYQQLHGKNDIANTLTSEMLEKLQLQPEVNAKKREILSAGSFTYQPKQQPTTIPPEAKNPDIRLLLMRGQGLLHPVDVLRRHKRGLQPRLIPLQQAQPHGASQRKRFKEDHEEVVTSRR